MGGIIQATIAAAGIVLLANDAGQVPAARELITFTKHIASLVAARCSTCHRPGGSAPFSLRTYSDVASRTAQIAAAIRRRAMPPWKPEPGYGEFAGARRLTDDEIRLFEEWIQQGAPEGNPSDLPQAAQWNDDWQLGAPDLVLSMPEAYIVPASGHDLFRNFVIPIDLPARRYVRAWEFRPGGSGIVHHVSMGIDRARAARLLDQRDPRPGYEGIVPFSVGSPAGYFLGWAPGQQQPQTALAGMPWVLDKDTDLVISMHLRPNGREQPVRASLALYFSDTPPSYVPALLRLGRQDIDIPAGEQHYVIANEYRLPVDAAVYTVYPHAHHLAREIKAFATLPDGTRRWLLYIKDWDFDWQDLYRYAEPIALPAGATVRMEYTYDNSSTNPRNPHLPPHRVLYGPNGSDEMGDLWIQVLPRDPAQLPLLVSDFERQLLPQNIAGLEKMLSGDPENAGLHDEAGVLYQDAGDFERAAAHFAESVRLSPASAAAHNNLGSALLRQGKASDARIQLLTAVRLNPSYAGAHFNFGILLEQQGNLRAAEDEFRQAAALAPADAATRLQLGLVLNLQGHADAAIQEYLTALQVRPDYAEAHHLLGAALVSAGRVREGVPHYREAIKIRPDWSVPLIELAWVIATAPEEDVRRAGEALTLARRAAQMTTPPSVAALDVMAAALAALGDFNHAIEIAESAFAAATASHDERTAGGIRQHLDLYRAHQPVRALR